MNKALDWPALAEEMTAKYLAQIKRVVFAVGQIEEGMGELSRMPQSSERDRAMQSFYCARDILLREL